jgi:hypothetical protein
MKGAVERSSWHNQYGQSLDDVKKVQHTCVSSQFSVGNLPRWFHLKDMAHAPQLFTNLTICSPIRGAKETPWNP